jgi:hypothetical protein
MAARTYAQLLAASREELVKEYDWNASMTENVGLNFIREELFRRDLAESNARIERLTKAITWMTAAIGVLTVANVILVAVTLSH